MVRVNVDYSPKRGIQRNEAKWEQNTTCVLHWNAYTNKQTNKQTQKQEKSLMY